MGKWAVRLEKRALKSDMVWGMWTVDRVAGRRRDEEAIEGGGMVGRSVGQSVLAGVGRRTEGFQQFSEIGNARNCVSRVASGRRSVWFIT